jgi:hypothetical protein
MFEIQDLLDHFKVQMYEKCMYKFVCLFDGRSLIRNGFSRPDLAKKFSMQTDLKSTTLLPLG